MAGRARQPRIVPERGLMTPEKARELLDIANRGETGGERPVTVAANHAPLAEAAPALAELVAGMHYEYAVQFKHGDVWEYENGAFNDRSPVDDLYSEDPSVAFWWDCVEDAQREAARIDVTPTRITRRLVSDPGVVE